MLKVLVCEGPGARVGSDCVSIATLFPRLDNRFTLPTVVLFQCLDINAEVDCISVLVRAIR